MSDLRHNWAGNVSYQSARTHHPEAVEQLQEIVAASPGVKVFA